MSQVPRSGMITSHDQIMFFHMNAQRHALRLEIRGLGHSSGRSIAAHIRRTHGLKARSKAALLVEFTDLINERFGTEL